MKKVGFLLPVLLAGIILPVMLGGCSVPEQNYSLDEKAQDVYRSLMCPLCPGQTIDQSQTELSAQMRAIAREKLERGETKEEILQFFVERYGEAVLAAPVKTGFNLLVWFAPIIGIVVGAVVIAFTIRRWVRRWKESSSRLPISTADVAGDEKYLRQLEDELRNFGEIGFHDGPSAGEGQVMSRGRENRKILGEHRKDAVSSRRRGWFVFGISLLLFVGVLVGLLVFQARDEGQVAARPLSVLRTADYHSLAFSPDDPNVVLFGHHNGIMRSQDGGRTWSTLVGRHNFDAMGLVVSPDSRQVYVAGHDIFEASNDGGSSWEPVRHNLPGTDIHGFAMSPVDSSRLFAFVNGFGLFRSDDGGKTWLRITARLPMDIMGLAAAGGNPEVLYAVSMQQGLLRSGDGGQSWGTVDNLSKKVLSVAIDPAAPETVYAGVDGGLYRSNDGGLTWGKLPFPGSNAVALAASRAQPGRLIAISVVGDEGLVYRSEDGGRSW